MNLPASTKFPQLLPYLTWYYMLEMHWIVKKMTNKAWNTAAFLENLQEMCFHTLSFINSTYPSTIWHKSSANYAPALAQSSVSETLMDKTQTNISIADPSVYFDPYECFSKFPQVCCIHAGCLLPCRKLSEKELKLSTEIEDFFGVNLGYSYLFFQCYYFVIFLVNLKRYSRFLTIHLVFRYYSHVNKL
jgi:hypothetical protein